MFLPDVYIFLFVNIWALVTSLFCASLSSVLPVPLCSPLLCYISRPIFLGWWWNDPPNCASDWPVLAAFIGLVLFKHKELRSRNED